MLRQGELKFLICLIKIFESDEGLLIERIFEAALFIHEVHKFVSSNFNNLIVDL